MLDSSAFLAPLPSAARTATATSAVNELVGATMVNVTVTVTAQSGTAPTLDVTLEGSADGTTGWHTIATVAQFAASTGSKSIGLGPAALPRFIRTVATIAGTTPSFTFSVGIDVAGSSGQSVDGTLFVTQAEFDTQGPSGRELAFAASTAAQGPLSAETDLTGLVTASFTVAARPVYVDVTLPDIYSSTAALSCAAYITDEANAHKRTAYLSFSATGLALPIFFRERISTPGSYIRKVRLARVSGTGSWNTNLDTGNQGSIVVTEH